MLMNWPCNVGSDLASKCQIVTIDVRSSGQYAGQFDLKLDGTVQVEVPEKSVLIISHCRNGAYHQSPRPTNLNFACQHVCVFPADPEVLLMNADCVAGSNDAAIIKHLNCIQVENFS